MNTWDLYKELRRHRKYAGIRNVNITRNRTAKYVIYALFALLIIYLMLIAVGLAFIVNDKDNNEISSLELISALFPYILILDFLFRFIMQQTPSQIIKPYTLLPLKLSDCIDNFIFTSLLSPGNFVWFALLLPYALMSIVFSYGLLPTFLFLLYSLILIMANSQWYLIIRTLLSDTVAYWLIPIAVYALIFSPSFIGKDSNIERMLYFYSETGTLIQNNNILPVIFSSAILVVLVLINRKIQLTHVKKEISSSESSTSHKINSFSFLDKFGERGLYLQLEIKTILRNKTPRKGLIYSILLVVFFSCIICYTSVYDSRYMTNFWCLYNLIIFGSTMLINIMGNEGNYFDFLMTRRENILSLLNAKYLLYSLLLLLPFSLMLPIVIIGKWSMLMLVSYTIFTAGFQYFIIFQMAVYNRQTIPLNTKFTGRSNIEGNHFQILASIICMLFPLVLVSMLQLVFKDSVSYIIILIIGLIFILTHSLWLRNIYKRFMKRRYTNMEAFRSTRQ